ncbi:hypothetical protein ACP4OV_029869 [Aristida adscensionis]
MKPTLPVSSLLGFPNSLRTTAAPRPPPCTTAPHRSVLHGLVAHAAIPWGRPQSSLAAPPPG